MRTAAFWLLRSIGLLALCLVAEAPLAWASPSSCAQSSQMQRAVSELGDALATLPADDQGRLLAGLDCRRGDYGSTPEAVDACACRRAGFVCDLASSLLSARKLDPFGRAGLACHLG